MTLVDWAAFIGACAWLPVVIDWIRQWLKKPKINVIIDKSPEIGFSTFGSILNYKIALTAENGPVVITHMEIILRHESNETRVLTWEGMIQQYGSMTIEDKKMPLEKDQAALAIKIGDNDVDERFYRFQDANFNINRKRLYNKCIERMNIILNSKNDYREDLLKSDEIHNLREHLLNGLFWKPGKYTAELKISALTNILVIGNKFNFTLSSIDVDRLVANRSQIPGVIENEVNQGKEEHEDVKPIWNWQYPVTEKNV